MNFTISKSIFLAILILVSACGSQSSGDDRNILDDIITIASGNQHSLAVKSDGTVLAWGLNDYGQLGNNYTDNALYPLPVGGLEGIVAVAAGNQHSLALTSSGTVFTWGRNNMGQLGDGSNTDSFEPVKALDLTDVVAIHAGWAHSIALKEDGTIWAWGNNNYGQLATLETSNNLVPNQVQGIEDVAKVYAGSEHNIALLTAGTAWVWGRNTQGQLGTGTTDYDAHNIPIQIEGFDKLMDVTAGWGHSAFLNESGDVWVWGDNDEGQIGDGTTANQYIPTQTSDIYAMTAIESGYFNMTALTTEGTIKSWGRNIEGELGAGSSALNSTIPLDVTYLEDVHKIFCGMYHCLSLLGNGEVWAWGSNENGQLGDGTTTSYSAPGPVLKSAE